MTLKRPPIHLGRGRTLVLALATLVSASMPSQNRVSLIDPVDRELIFGFFTMVHSLPDDLKEKGQTNPVGGRDRGTVGMSLFGISESDFKALTEVAAGLDLQLRELAREAVAYVDGERKAGRLPDSGKMRGFEECRRVLLEDALLQIQRKLSSKGWNSVWTYIQTKLRSGFVRSPAAEERQ